MNDDFEKYECVYKVFPVPTSEEKDKIQRETDEWNAKYLWFNGNVHDRLKCEILDERRIACSCSVIEKGKKDE